MSSPDLLRFTFKRSERLKGRNAIREVFGKGKRASCSGIKLFFLQNGLSYNRIAVTFSRKFGIAVKRNRSRRCSREAYRHIRALLMTGYDMVLLVYSGNDSFAARLEQLDTLFMKAGLIKDMY
ncbi:MAG: ribonuclease P protein component [Treponema sp.]|nr:ribonuclease P protein component [Treponema sp.]